MKKGVVVIPTYNEAENIQKLLLGILQNFKSLSVIVVDDNSPDGTYQKVEDLIKNNKRLYLIKRKAKNGRGSAVLEGFKFAYTKSPYFEYFIEMDADFSHNPKELIRLIEKSEKFDVVIASRYKKLSKIYGWGFGRRFFSKLANYYCRLLLGVPISDYTNGFRCYSRKVISRLINLKFKSHGYIVLSETAYFLYRNNFNFAETSTVFVNRRRGKSNFSISEIKESFVSIFKIRFSQSP